MLDNLDKELERRGLKFVRYADDFMIFVKSSRSAERVFQSVQRYVTETLPDVSYTRHALRDVEQMPDAAPNRDKQCRTMIHCTNATAACTRPKAFRHGCRTLRVCFVVLRNNVDELESVFLRGSQTRFGD